MNDESEFRDRHILVVGGAGYVGTVLVNQLLCKRCRVRVADNLIYSNDPLLMQHWNDPMFSYVNMDLRFDSTFADALEGITDIVFLAALVGDPITKKYPKQSHDINVVGTVKFLEAVETIQPLKFIFVSTCSNYGMHTAETPATEDSELNPLSIYAENKVEIENKLLKNDHGIPFTILRFATAFGLSPRMRFDLTVSEFTRDLYLGKELLVYDAETWRPYCHVNDMAEAMLLVLKADQDLVRGKVFNTGGDLNNYTKRSIVEIIQKHLPTANVHYQYHGGDPRNYRVDFSKIKEDLEFSPMFSVEQGIIELLDALKCGMFQFADDNPNFYGNRIIPRFEAVE